MEKLKISRRNFIWGLLILLIVFSTSCSQNTISYSPKDSTTPKQIIASGVTAISSGINITMAVMNDGSGRAWGFNDQGQLTETSQAGQKGFFDGLIAPLSFVPVVVSGFFSSNGIDNFNQHVADTWGQGSTSYRFGFVVGVIIIFVIIGGIGGGISEASSKKK